MQCLTFGRKTTSESQIYFTPCWIFPTPHYILCGKGGLVKTVATQSCSPISLLQFHNHASYQNHPWREWVELGNYNCKYVRAQIQITGRMKPLMGAFKWLSVIPLFVPCFGKCIVCFSLYPDYTVMRHEQS